VWLKGSVFADVPPGRRERTSAEFSALFTDIGVAGQSASVRLDPSRFPANRHDWLGRLNIAFYRTLAEKPQGF
jgi:hypothetical protein